MRLRAIFVISWVVFLALIVLQAIPGDNILYADTVDTEEPGEEMVYVIPIEDHAMITAGTASFVRRQIEEATLEGANAIVIVLDTPGGLVDATLELNKVMRGTDIPVIVYVAPAGAIAASAGAFLLLSGDVAAMSPGTTVGAAEPVSMAPEGEVDPADDKTTQLLAGHIRSIARESGRPEDVAERFVTENLVLGYDEAVEKGIADLVSPSLQELMIDLDGMEVEKRGQTITLETEGVPLRNVNMNPRENFQNWVSNPQIAFILLMLGIMGIYTGLSMPGTFVPEILGGLMLVIGIYGMGLFDTNTTGIVLMVLGVGLIVAEIFTAGFGILGIGGAISLLVGSILLPLEPLMAPDWVEAFRITVIGVVIGISIIMLVVVQRVISSRRNRREEAKFFYGPEKGEVVNEIPPSESGMVKVKGELWKARNVGEETLPGGREVEVVGKEGLIILVKSSADNGSEQ